MSNVLEIIPLGGIGEFGMNCMAVRYGDEMLILDAGMGFPDSRTATKTISARCLTSLRGSMFQFTVHTSPPDWRKANSRSMNS